MALGGTYSQQLNEIRRVTRLRSTKFKKNLFKQFIVDTCLKTYVFSAGKDCKPMWVAGYPFKV
jgi:hypothetical protein